MATLQAVSGMNDLLPADGQGARWHRLETAFRDTSVRYGFQEVRTPLCEYAELFQRGVGEATDIVEKEMYTFDDRGQRRLALRPEGTASAVRAAIEHSVLAREPVVRWSYVGAMFRAERPAKGRYRQFHQVGAEVYGDDSPAVDAEVIDLASSFLQSIGITKFIVRVNSLGGAETRARYREALLAYFAPHREALSPESQLRLERNPLRILDSKDPRDQAFKAGAPSLVDALTPEDRAHFERVQGFLTALGTPFVVDASLVRGLDYYSRTVFEIVDTSGSLGAQDALGGGGRYDQLFTDLGSAKPVPAFGFALGIERLLLAAPVEEERKPFRVAVVAVAKPDENTTHAGVLALARELRMHGFETVVDTRFGSMKSQMRRANDLAAAVVLLIGSNELAAEQVSMKLMATGEQRSVPRAALLDELTQTQRAPAATGAP
jgi:histidyl-tRNA synthetase